MGPKLEQMYRKFYEFVIDTDSNSLMYDTFVDDDEWEAVAELVHMIAAIRVMRGEGSQSDILWAAEFMGIKAPDAKDETGE